MLINSLSLALGATLDKIALKVSPPLFYNFANTLGAAFVLAIFAFSTDRDFVGTVKKKFKLFTAIGTIQAIAFTLYILALQTGLVGYVVTIKSSNVLLGAVWGIYLFSLK